MSSEEPKKALNAENGDAHKVNPFVPVDSRSIFYTSWTQAFDCFGFIAFLLLVCMWVAVAGYSYHKAEPDRLYLGTDYLGDVCGKKNAKPPGWDQAVKTAKAFRNNTDTRLVEPLFFQSEKWEDNTRLWLPVSIDLVRSLTKGSLVSKIEELAKYGVCVNRCPDLAEYATALKATGYSGDFAALQKKWLSGSDEDIELAAKVWTYGANNSNGKQAIFGTFPQYYNVGFSSTEEYNRCFSKSSLNITGVTTELQKLPIATEITEFFFKGVTEIAESWKVFMLAGVLCFLFAIVFMIMINFVGFYLIVGVIVAVLLVLGAAAAVCWQNAETIKTLQKDSTVVKRSDLGDSYKFWQAFCGLFLIGLFSTLLVISLARSKIADAVDRMKESLAIIMKAQGLLFVPIGAVVFIFVVMAWSIICGICLYTVSDWNQAVSQVTGLIPNATATVVQGLKGETTLRNLLAFDIFMFLWTAAIVNGVVYMTSALTIAKYYFSWGPADPQGNTRKVTNNGEVASSLLTSLRYLPNVCFGTLLITLLQFPRLVCHYFETLIIKNCDMDCLYDCWEAAGCGYQYFLKYASRLSYGYTAIKGGNFLDGTIGGIRVIMTESDARFGSAVYALAEFVMFFGKVVCVLVTSLIAWGMMGTQLAPKVNIKIAPMIIVVVLCFVVMELFSSVFSSVCDTLLLCYMTDAAFTGLGPNGELQYSYGQPGDDAQATAAQAQALGLKTASSMRKRHSFDGKQSEQA